MTVNIPEEMAGIRLEQAVQRLFSISRKRARIAIREGRVSVNGRMLKILAKNVRAGQKLRLLQEEPSQDLRAQAPTILALDSYIAVINKPAGLLSESTSAASPSLLDVLPPLLEAEGAKGRDLWLVHRLDAGTSGVMVLARRNKAVRALSDAFRHRQVQKTYLAVVQGSLKDQVLDTPVGKLKGSLHGVCESGKPAQTKFRTIAAGEEFSLVECSPRSGRTHQIRVHLHHLGCPIAGDKRYGGPRYGPLKTALPQFFLHAQTLAFKHPKDESLQRFEVLPPLGWKEFFPDVCGALGF